MTFPKNTKILLVEDNRINQAVVMGVLSSWGVSADIANNGQEALDILKKQVGSTYQLVLMDCQMPIMDGYHTTEIIRACLTQELPQDIPIIAMTANTMQGDKEKCINAGMSDYLSKPVDADKLREKIIYWLNSARVEHPLKELTCNLKNEADVITSIPPPISESSELNTQQETNLGGADNDIWQFEHLLVRMRNNQAMVKKLVEMFIEDNVAIKAQLAQAIEENNFAELQSLAHKIKGSARNLSFVALGNILNTIESAAKAHRIDNISELYQQFIREYDKLMPLLTEYLTN